MSLVFDPIKRLVLLTKAVQCQIIYCDLGFGRVLHFFHTQLHVFFDFHRL